MTNKDTELLPYQMFTALKHGHTIRKNGKKQSRTYQSWLSMHTRCRAKHRDTENKYVNRGIKVCYEWNKFDAFLSDMGERPEGKTLDRVDCNGDYSPNNCKWSTPTEQARNTRRNKLNYDKALDIAKRMIIGEKAKALSIEYGISESLVRAIDKGTTWKDAHNESRRA